MRKIIGIMLTAIIIIATVPTLKAAPSGWAEKEVNEAVSLKIVPSELQTAYQNGITRQEFAKTAVFTVAVLKGTSVSTLLSQTKTNIKFTDTNDPYVLCAAGLNILKGRGNGIFDPKSRITREEAAVMIRQAAQALSQPGRSVPLNYADSDAVSSWAKDGVAFVTATMLMIGVGDNRFDPMGTYTREQAFVVFLHFYKMSFTEAAVSETIASMTLNEKVGQLFLCDPGMLCDAWETSTANQTLLNNVKKYNPAGFVFFKPNIKTPDQTKRFIAALQSSSKVKLIISVDEEGGTVSRIGSNPDMNFKLQPAMSVIGKTGDTKKAYQVGSELGSGLRGLGFNMDFAPVADVNTNPKNPVIGTRSFGSDPNLVAGMVAEEVKGLQDNGVSAVLKHFPGHGDSSTDSHTGAVSLTHNKTRLNTVEFVPFKSGITAGADAVMVSHIALPNVTGSSEPATISSKIVNGILRGDLSFDGLVVTDSLSMGAVSKYYALPDFCVKSIQAGCDLLLLQSDTSKGSTINQFDSAYNAVLTAVKNGSISEDRLNQSVRRILRVKYGS